MRKVSLLGAVVLGVATTVSAATSQSERGIVGMIVPPRTTGVAVGDILRRHADLIAAVREGAGGETLIAVGRTLVAAQVAALPESQRKALSDFVARSKRLLNLTLPALRWLAHRARR